MSPKSSRRAVLATVSTTLRAWSGALADALWPGRCAATGTLLASDADGPLCDALRRQLRPLGWLPRRDVPAGLDGVFALYAYDAALATAIRRWKYGGREAIGRALVGCVERELAARWGPALSGRALTVVPVPIHPRRLRERGFDQTRILARAVASALRATHHGGGVDLRPDALVRTRATPAQASLDRAARAANVRDAFRVGCPLIGAVCLVDDVVTTGATASACASALRARGAGPVVLVTVARAGDDTPLPRTDQA